jgi:hypothetical protein
MRPGKIYFTALGLLAALTGVAQTTGNAVRPELLLNPHGNFSNNVARPLRYWPVAGDFVITNGAEFFNRPLYCRNSGFRIDGGDKPEFSLYLPGRGGNLRLGIKTPTGTKWLNDAAQIVTRYRAGSLIYEVYDPVLGGAGLELTVLPLSETKGVIIRAGILPGTTLVGPVSLIFAYGGANGARGVRGGDIGCERQPVSEFFQLRPEECRDNIFSITNNTFTLRLNKITIAGVTPPGTKLSVADATEWDFPESLLASVGGDAGPSVIVGETEIEPIGEDYLTLQQLK